MSPQVSFKGENGQSVPFGAVMGALGAQESGLLAHCSCKHSRLVAVKSFIVVYQFVIKAELDVTVTGAANMHRMCVLTSPKSDTTGQL